MTFPTSEFSSIEVYQDVEVIAPDRRYKRVKRLDNKEPFWVIALTTPPNEYEKAMEIGAYLDSLLGPLNDFVLPNPVPSIKSRVGLSTNALASKGATTVQIKGATANLVKACAAGDFLNFTGFSKAYRFVLNSNADATGIFTATITPPLIEDIPANTAIKYGSDAEFQVCLDSVATTDINARAGKLISHDVELIEQG